MRKNDHTQPYRIPGVIEEHGSAPSIPNENGNTLESLWYWCDRMLDYHPVSMLYYDIAVLLCLHREGLIINGDFCPNPSKEHCNIYAKAWETTGYGRGDFMLKCGHQAWKNLIAYIQEMKVTKATCLKAIDRYVGSTSNLGEDIYVQPNELTELGLGLLDYKQGTVYNPFAGAASYGLAMSVGELYHGEEIEPRTWVIGTLRMILKNCHSSNYVLGDSTKGFLGDSATAPCKQKFDNVITTPPFGLKLGVENMVTEEFLLYRSEHILTEKGKMVLFVPASFANKAGKFATIRQRITESNMLDTVIALPKETFQPYTSIKTVAIILRKGRKESSVRFLDARECVNKKALDSGTILARLKDENYYLDVKIDSIRDNGYSWHPAKYEDDQVLSESGFSHIRLKEVLVPTGTTEAVSSTYRSVSLSDLSDNPFDFIRKATTLTHLNNVATEEADAIDRQLQEYRVRMDSLSAQQESIQAELNTTEKRLASETEANAQWESDYEAKLRMECEIIRKQLDEISYELSLENRSFSNKTPSDKSRILELKRAELEAALQEKIHEGVISKNKFTENREFSIKKIQYEKQNLLVQMKANHEEIDAISKKISELYLRKEFLDPSSKRKVKVVHPVFLIGGNKSKVKFLYIDASPITPIFLESSHCFAFKVDTNVIDINYLALQISELTFKDYGETVPLISRDEILNAVINICDLALQAKYYEEKKNQSNPLLKEILELNQKLVQEREKFKQEEGRLLAALGSKQHDMGNLVPKITLQFADLSDNIEDLPDDTVGKQMMIRQLDIINESLNDLNKIIRIISERNDFPEPEKIELIQFFSNYQETHPGTGYDFFPPRFDKLDLEDGGIYVPVSEIALTRALMNIRDNAEMHGFNPDTSGKQHYFEISMHVDHDNSVCHIDFANNGLPMEKGMTAKIYGTKGEKSPITGHTGNGGWYVTEMAHFYGGECSINPEDASQELTTIRITLPLYNE